MISARKLSTKSNEKISAVDIAMVSLAIFALLLFFISFAIDLTPRQEELFGIADFGVCAIFIVELAFRFSHASSKKRCLRESWADIIGSIPTTMAEGRFIRAFRAFRVARVARVAKVARVTRAARVTRVTKAAKLLKLARRLPKLLKTAGKIRKMFARRRKE